jgi:hypothetical protein
MLVFKLISGSTIVDEDALITTIAKKLRTATSAHQGYEPTAIRK